MEREGGAMAVPWISLAVNNRYLAEINRRRSHEDFHQSKAGDAELLFFGRTLSGRGSLPAEHLIQTIDLIGTSLMYYGLSDVFNLI
jgi:hypothetical protein